MWTDNFLDMWVEGDDDYFEDLRNSNPELYYTLKNKRAFLEDSYIDEGLSLIDSWNQADDEVFLRRTKHGEVFSEQTDIQ